MPWQVNTCDRIMAVLELPVTVYYVQQVQDALSHAEVHGGEPTVTRIEGYLDTHAELETALNTNASQSGLIRVDVVEWSPGGAISGYKNEMKRVKRQIANALLLNHLCSAGTRLVRRR